MLLKLKLLRLRDWKVPRQNIATLTIKSQNQNTHGSISVCQNSAKRQQVKIEAKMSGLTSVLHNLNKNQLELVLLSTPSRPMERSGSRWFYEWNLWFKICVDWGPSRRRVGPRPLPSPDCRTQVNLCHLIAKIYVVEILVFLQHFYVRTSTNYVSRSTSYCLLK